MIMSKGACYYSNAYILSVSGENGVMPIGIPVDNISCEQRCVQQMILIWDSVMKKKPLHWPPSSNVIWLER